MSIKEVMTSRVSFVQPSTPKIRRLPAINRDKRLVGVVSLGDLALTAQRTAAGDALLEISQPTRH